MELALAGENWPHAEYKNAHIRDKSAGGAGHRCMRENKGPHKRYKSGNIFRDIAARENENISKFAFGGLSLE